MESGQCVQALVLQIKQLICTDLRVLVLPGLEQTGQEEASPILSSAPAQRVVQAKLPEGIVPGASVFAVEQHVQYISPEELQGKG